MFDSISRKSVVYYFSESPKLRYNITIFSSGLILQKKASNVYKVVQGFLENTVPNHENNLKLFYLSFQEWWWNTSCYLLLLWLLLFLFLFWLWIPLYVKTIYYRTVFLDKDTKQPFDEILLYVLLWDGFFSYSLISHNMKLKSVLFFNRSRIEPKNRGTKQKVLFTWLES